MSRSLCAVLVLSVLSIAGCKKRGGSSDDPPTTGVPPSTGLTFSRHRDPASGDIQPVLTESGGSGFDSAEVDSPHVVVDSSRPGGDKYLMFYEALSAGGVSTIGVVSSDEEDFETLTVGRTQAIGLGAPTSGFNFAATDPCVIVNPDASFPYGVDGHYIIWFEGRTGTGGAQSVIITATSPDGVNWNNFTACTGLTASFALERVADPCVVYADGGFNMWFEGVDVASTIGYAFSADGVNWTVADGTGAFGTSAGPVFGLGPLGFFDAAGIHAPSVVVDPTLPSGNPFRVLLFYEASDQFPNATNTIGLAYSANGIQWEAYAVPTLSPSSDSISPLPFDSGDLEHPTAIIDDSFDPSAEGFILLWYAADSEGSVTPNRIGLARGYETP